MEGESERAENKLKNEAILKSIKKEKECVCV